MHRKACSQFKARVASCPPARLPSCLPAFLPARYASASPGDLVQRKSAQRRRGGGGGGGGSDERARLRRRYIFSKPCSPSLPHFVATYRPQKDKVVLLLLTVMPSRKCANVPMVPGHCAAPRMCSPCLPLMAMAALHCCCLLAGK